MFPGPVGSVPGAYRDMRMGVGSCDVCHHSGVISHLQDCDQILTIYSTHDDTTGKETCNGKFFLPGSFYDFSKEINILIFHRRRELVKHTSSEALQPFEWTRITKAAASDSKSFQPKSCHSEVIYFHVTESMGESLKSNKIT